MNKFIKLIITLFLFGSAEASSPKKVLISQVVTHPALDATAKGIVDTLKEGGFTTGENLIIRLESAQANAALAQQIATKFAAQSPDIVVGIGTLSAQSLKKAATSGKSKLVFSSVTDPTNAGLEKLPNITGVSNFVALEPQLALFKKLQPNLKKLGILYSPGELNSASILTKLEELCLKSRIELIKQSVNKSADIPQNALKLAKNADAIFICNDNTVLSGLQGVIKAANTANIPVYVSDTDAVELGALAALGPNQYEVGKQTGKMISKLLTEESTDLPAIEYPKTTELYLNLAVAKKLGISIPQDLIDSAAKTILETKI